MLRRAFEVSKEQWKQVKHKAIDCEITISEAIRRLLQKWINGEIEI